MEVLSNDCLVCLTGLQLILSFFFLKKLMKRAANFADVLAIHLARLGDGQVGLVQVLEGLLRDSPLQLELQRPAPRCSQSFSFYLAFYFPHRFLAGRLVGRKEGEMSLPCHESHPFCLPLLTQPLPVQGALP